MLVGKEAGEVSQGRHPRAEEERRKKTSTHRRRVRQDLHRLKELYNSGGVELVEMDFIHQKPRNEMVSVRDVY